MDLLASSPFSGGLNTMFHWLYNHEMTILFCLISEYFYYYLTDKKIETTSQIKHLLFSHYDSFFSYSFIWKVSLFSLIRFS